MTAPFAYSEASREAAVEAAKTMATAGRAWHIHALHPGCQFNPRPESYCFVVEDTDQGATICAFSDQPFTRECQELVQLLHGAAILDAGRSAEGTRAIPIVRSVTEACVAGENWHHHMMKPGCVLSPAPERHVITLERESVEKIEILDSIDPLDDVLREIELMYFKRYE